MVITNDFLIGKMELYKLISLGFYYPTAEYYEELKSKKYYETFQEALEKSNVKLNDENLSLGLTLEDISFDNYESQYLLDFETNNPQPSCSLNERHYLKTPNNAQILIELKAFYKTFDLQKSSTFTDAEDHIVFQLEFMHFLTIKELQAIENGFESLAYTKCKRDFLERHLLKWIPDFVSKANKNIKSTFHKSLAEITKKLIELDYEETKKELNDN
jgi:DMSO reductase family type II enzyme chaperone